MRRKHGQKKIKTWQYDEGGLIIPISVYMCEGRRGEGVSFMAVTEQPEEEIHNDDISKLKVAIFDHLKGLVGIKWSPVFLICIAKTYFYNRESGEGISFTWEEYEVGVNGKGEDVYREQNLPRITVGKLEEEKLDNWDSDRRKQYSVVHATPANKVALVEIKNRFQLLREMCLKFFSPQQIQNTLDQAQKLLPLPKGE